MYSTKFGHYLPAKNYHARLDRFSVQYYHRKLHYPKFGALADLYFRTQNSRFTCIFIREHYLKMLLQQNVVKNPQTNCLDNDEYWKVRKTRFDLIKKKLCILVKEFKIISIAVKAKQISLVLINWNDKILF